MNARHEDPDTSHEAAASLNIGRDTQILADFLTAHDRTEGWTLSELRDSGHLNLHLFSVSQRISDALTRELIEVIGKRQSLDSGRSQRAYRVKVRELVSA